MSRPFRKQLASETVEIVERGEYAPRFGSRVNIADAVAAAVETSRLFTPEDLKKLLDNEPPIGALATKFEVSNETTLSAATRLVVHRGLNEVLCLNFASAKKPGGGFLSGAQAQEESLARSSALYLTLKVAPEFYERNHACGTALYTDHMILSPRVPVIRDDAGTLLDQPYALSILTAPAVNAGAVRKNERTRVANIADTMRRRIAMVLAVAEHQGFRHLVLGAWGCGVFQNDPREIAGLFAEWLTGDGRYACSFETVSFAVLDRPDETILGPFRKAFDVRKGLPAEQER